MKAIKPAWHNAVSITWGKQRKADAALAIKALQPIARAVIHGVGRHHMAANRYCFNERGNGLHARWKQQTFPALLQRRHGLFGLPQRRVAVALVVFLEQWLVIFIPRIGRCQMNWRNHGPGRGIG